MLNVIPDAVVVRDQTLPVNRAAASQGRFRQTTNNGRLTLQIFTRRLRATAHPGAAMTTTWFDGRFEDFVESCEASWRKGSRSQHFLGGTVAEITI